MVVAENSAVLIFGGGFGCVILGGTKLPVLGIYRALIAGMIGYGLNILAWLLLTTSPVGHLPPGIEE